MMRIDLLAGEKREIVDNFGPSAQIEIFLNKESELVYSFKNDSVEQNINREIVINLVGEGASAVINWAFLARHSSIVQLKTMQHHLAQNTKSDVTVKSVLFDSSKLITENLIKIDKKGQKTVAFEENKNFLIGDLARAISIPKLEIDANDVSASHGSATSKINKEQVFYLQSRGFSPENAQIFLIDAFLS